MKKLLIGLLMLVTGAFCFGKEVVHATEIEKEPVIEQSFVDGMKLYVRAGIAPWSDYHADGSSVDGDSVGFETAIEVTKDIEKVPNLEVGLGFGFHQLADGETRFNHQTVAKYEDYESYPVYVTAKYSFPVVGDGVTPYVKADLGYAFNGRVKYDVANGFITGKEGVDNGLYAGIGAGIEQNNINVDIMYKTTQGKVDKNDVDNYRLIMSVSYKFDLGKYF